MRSSSPRRTRAKPRSILMYFLFLFFYSALVFASVPGPRTNNLYCLSLIRDSFCASRFASSCSASPPLRFVPVPVPFSSRSISFALPIPLLLLTLSPLLLPFTYCLNLRYRLSPCT
ncbi:hypothetical protein BJY52DRAFT_716041 [Lactarius psammicola]|nr:hypothetical protein BJY52DRAFT_716041 [Lactarius psammicola]